MIWIFFIINGLISWWNARVAGLLWIESKMTGGWKRLSVWAAAIMSACGFTWCYMVLIVFGLASLNLDPASLMPLESTGEDPGIFTYLLYTFAANQETIVTGVANLAFLILVPGVLFAGYIIWIDSLIEAWKRRDLPSMGIAAWNSYASLHNTWGAFRGIGGVFHVVRGLFKGDGDRKGAVGLIVFVLAVIAVLAGVLTTVGIVRKYAAVDDLPDFVKERHQHWT